MNKEEFLRQLDEYLMGNVSDVERIDSIRYYREYLEEEIRAGKNEGEILSSLGSAYGIAKSIIEAKGYEYDPSDRNDYEEYAGSEDGNTMYREEQPSYHHRELLVSGWKVWAVAAGVIIVLLLILSLVFKVFLALIPFVVPFLFVVFLIKMFTNR